MADVMAAYWAALLVVHLAVLSGAIRAVQMVASRAVTKVVCWVEHSVSSSVVEMVDQSVVV